MGAMKLMGKILLGIFALAVIALLVGLWRASAARGADRDYHAAIPKTLVLKSESFLAGGEIPGALTCQGAGSSPQLSWAAAPKNTQSYALVMMDWDGPSPNLRLGSFTHWILYDVPQDTHEIKASIASVDLSQANIVAGKNSLDTTDYTPPCPPIGSHTYVFRIYALDVPELHLVLRDRRALFEAMKGHVLAFGELQGHFGGKN
jgi:Raf kinase inhibitor-like YbhB/YbcL family protein